MNLVGMEEALGWERGAEEGSGMVVVVKDSVASSASFMLSYLLGRAIASHDHPPPLVIFIALQEPFSHYHRIARKQGYNLAAYRESGSFVFMDMLTTTNVEEYFSHIPLVDESQSKCVDSLSKNLLLNLYQDIHKILRKHSRRNAWIFVDDVSLLEVKSQGSKEDLLNFFHYCRTLSSDKQRCKIILLIHQDVYQSQEGGIFMRSLEYWADIVMNTEPLSSGSAIDVDGQLTVFHRRHPEIKSAAGRMPDAKQELFNFHYKISENTSNFFPPGKH